MGDTLDARIAFLQRQLHAINLAIGQAQSQPEPQRTETIARLKELYASVVSQVAALSKEAHASDAPSALLVTLDNFGDEVAETGKKLAAAAGDVVGGVAALVKYLPVILLVALVVVGLVYAGKIRKDLK